MLHTSDSEFKIVIKRKVSISNYSVNDIHYSDGLVKIISVRDGELFLDVVALTSAQGNVSPVIDSQQLLSNYYDSPFKCLEFQWPYIFYIYQSKQAIVISVNHTKSLFNFTLPRNSKEENNTKLTNMYITERHEMFLATFLNGRYYIYRVVDSLKALIHQDFIEHPSKVKSY